MSDLGSLLLSDRVLYQCHCGLRKPVTNIYFCRHCLKLRCHNCVHHEVDSYFCPNCLQNIPSAEAKLKKNRCANCFNCPSCSHTLSTRASTIQVRNPEDPSKTVPKKVYYLVCGFCRWTTRDIGWEDQSIASGGWVENESIYTKRYMELLEYYRSLAQREKQEKERRKLSRKRGYLHISDKYGLPTIIARKRAGLPSIAPLSLKDEEAKILHIPEANVSDVVEPLSEDYFTKPLDLTQVTSLAQRLAQPDSQPVTVKGLYPRHKHLHIRQSRRCKECEHNLCKPEFSPSSVKFKLQLSAFYHIPNIKIFTVPKLEIGQMAQIVLTLYNPSQHPCHMVLLPLDSDEPDPLVTAKVELPVAELTLAARDDAAEFDELSDVSLMAKADPNIIPFQKANKIGVNVRVTPQRGHDDVRIAFRLKWDYVNTLLATVGGTTITLSGSGEGRTEPQIMWLDTRIDIYLGKVTSS